MRQKGDGVDGFKQWQGGENRVDKGPGGVQPTEAFGLPARKGSQQPESLILDRLTGSINSAIPLSLRRGRRKKLTTSSGKSPPCLPPVVWAAAFSMALAGCGSISPPGVGTTAFVPPPSRSVVAIIDPSAGQGAD